MPIQNFSFFLITTIGKGYGQKDLVITPLVDSSLIWFLRSLISDKTILQINGYQLGEILPLRGHLAMSEEVFGCQNCGVVVTGV